MCKIQNEFVQTIFNLERDGVDGRELHAKYDRFMKMAASTDPSNTSSGDVESPAGYFTFIDMHKSEDRQGIIDEVNEWCTVADLDVPEPGFYLVLEDNNGLAFVYEYVSESSARIAFATLDKVYARWLDRIED